MNAYLKTLTYSMMHMTVAIAVAYALSGSWVIALGIGITEPLVQTVFYHIHETVWKRAGNDRPHIDGNPAAMPS